MANIFICKTLAGKDMTQMTLAIGADDLSAAAVRICDAGDRTFYLIVKTWPATSGAELVF